MALLNDGEIQEKLKDLEGWTREGDEIVKHYEFDGFLDAIAFVQKVAERAESADHHPDIDIRYSKVKLALSTHSEGGITNKDIQGAKSFDEAAG